MGGTGCHDRGTGGLHSAGGHASERFVKAFAHETKGADRSAWSVDCPKAEVMAVGAKRGFKESGLRGAWTGDFFGWVPNTGWTGKRTTDSLRDGKSTSPANGPSPFGRVDREQTRDAITIITVTKPARLRGYDGYSTPQYITARYD